MLGVLEENDFSARSLGRAPDWDDLDKYMKRDISYFKRIGSGTKLSKAITSPNKSKLKFLESFKD